MTTTTQDLIAALRFETDGCGTIRLVTQTDPTTEPEVWAEYTPTNQDDSIEHEAEVFGWCASIAEHFFEQHARRQGWVE